MAVAVLKELCVATVDRAADEPLEVDDPAAMLDWVVSVVVLVALVLVEDEPAVANASPPGQVTAITNAKKTVNAFRLIFFAVNLTVLLLE